MGQDGAVSSPAVRFIDPGEAREWLIAEQRSFGIEPDDQRLGELAPTTEILRACAAFDGTAIVATGGAFTTTMRLPGGASVPVAAITAIGTRPTHIRRGLFGEVMDQLHTQSAELDEAATVLLASEALLYPRFGYGVATTGASVQIDRRRAEFRPQISVSDRLEMFVDIAASDQLVADLWQRAGEHRPGWLSRPPQLRAFILADHEVERGGAMGFTLIVHHDTDGSPDGYCLYRRTLKWEQGQSAGSLFVHELVTSSPQAHLALWHHCLNIDLVETVAAMPVPVDDPLPEALADRRQYRTIGLHDQVWLRPHDAANLLATRHYAVADLITIDVADVGRFRIDGGSAGAAVTTTTAEPDISCGRAELGSLVVGNSLRPLVASGRASLGDPASLDRVDRFFRWPVAPYSLLDF